MGAIGEVVSTVGGVIIDIDGIEVRERHGSGGGGGGGGINILCATSITLHCSSSVYTFVDRPSSSDGNSFTKSGRTEARDE